jgi:hypothetical protein
VQEEDVVDWDLRDCLFLGLKLNLKTMTLCGGGGARGGCGGLGFEGPLVFRGVDGSPLHRYMFLFIDSLGLRERRD